MEKNEPKDQPTQPPSYSPPEVGSGLEITATETAGAVQETQPKQYVLPRERKERRNLTPELAEQRKQQHALPLMPQIPLFQLRPQPRAAQFRKHLEWYLWSNFMSCLN